MTQWEPKRCYRCDISLRTPVTAPIGGPASGRLNDFFGICDNCKADLRAARAPSTEPAELTKHLKRE